VIYACGDRDQLSLTVNARGRGISTIPLLIAEDQGLFVKHGLHVRLLLPPPDNEYGKEALTDFEKWRLRIEWRLGFGKPGGEINLFGGTPLMLQAIQDDPAARNLISIGSTDCTVRTHIIGRKGLKIGALKDLAGMRLGASRLGTTGFVSLLLADRMGWDPGRDIELVPKNDLEDLDAGTVDAIFAYERAYALAVQEGYPVLFDMSEWNEEFAGNSIAADREWLKDPTNREAARRFLMAIAEAISLYHRDRALALRIMDTWDGMRGEYAERIYERGAWLPRKPYPCYTGHKKTLELFGAPEVQAIEAYHLPGIKEHSAEEFYDDSLMREIDASGFFDELPK
jgi:ABC-type nitrate/sulfonate/bicarbonate transport system substrate-binding protein